MRIGTWNLAGKWSMDHLRVLEAADCDIWLLSEVPPRVFVDGYAQVLSASQLTENVHWSGLLTRLAAEPRLDAQGTIAAAEIADLVLVSSVLPWPEPHADDPWEGESHQDRYATALADVARLLAGSIVIWGGNWNQPLEGNIIGYSRQAQEAVLDFVERHELQVPTRDLLGRNRQYSTDHVAVPATWVVAEAGKVEVDEALSPYDAFFVDAAPAAATASMSESPA